MPARACLVALLTTFLFAGAATSSHAQPDLVETLQCAACHGPGGVSTEPEVPILSGASDFFLENQLIQFQESMRPCAAEAFEALEDAPAGDHCALTSDFTEDDMHDIAVYYSEQPKVAADQPVDNALADRGARIHEQRCDRCHTDGGSLALDDSGILAGQWKAYLISSMHTFMAGNRWQEERMEEEMAELSEGDLQALAEYYAREGERFR